MCKTCQTNAFYCRYDGYIVNNTGAMGVLTTEGDN